MQQSPQSVSVNIGLSKRSNQAALHAAPHTFPQHPATLPMDAALSVPWALVPLLPLPPAPCWLAYLEQWVALKQLGVGHGLLLAPSKLTVDALRGDVDTPAHIEALVLQPLTVLFNQLIRGTAVGVGAEAVNGRLRKCMKCLERPSSGDAAALSVQLETCMAATAVNALHGCMHSIWHQSPGQLLTSFGSGMLTRW